MANELSKSHTTSLFPHPWFMAYSDIGPVPLCLDEWIIINISQLIRAKKNWQQKLHNADIVRKWASELCSQSSSKNNKLLFQYALQELDWYIELGEKIPEFNIECDDKIITSDSIISKPVKDKFLSEMQEFIDDIIEKDYHPGSNNQVLDLVHPSLYPLQYGITPIKSDTNPGEIELCQYSDAIKDFKFGVSKHLMSTKFQWLPSLFKINNGKFEIKSYINNLHPKYVNLYSSIETIFNLAVPGLNFVLSRTISDQIIRIKIPPGREAYNESYNELVDKFWDEHFEDANFDEKYEELCDKKNENVKPLKIEYHKPEMSDFNVRDFNELKVIVKLSDIELNPENPRYEGGSWHVEGTINEDIVATILYYYDSENISESRLSFRSAFEEPVYEQDDEFYCQHFYGLKDEDSYLHKYIGSIECKNDRLLIFPNILQHHVDPFELVDKTKPGHRKILCMFLVDPYNNLVKTTNDVPPQQSDWQDILDKDMKLKINHLLPDWPMSFKHVKEVREDLMKERSIPEDYDDFIPPFNRQFSLCEH